MRSIMDEDRSQVTESTREAEAEEARAPHVADRAPTPAEEEAAKDLEVDPDVRAHYQEMTELGANEVGEGRIP
jgi:hypothetical protein